MGRSAEPKEVPGGARTLWLGAALLLIAGIGALTSRGDVPGDAARPPVTVLLVDTSASVVRTRKDAPRRMVRAVRDEVQGARERGHDLALVTFDQVPVVHFGPGDPGDFDGALRASGADWFQRAADGGGPGSDLAAAVRVAAGLMVDVPAGGDQAPRPPGTLVVFGDGTATGSDPARALADPAMGAVRLAEPGPVTRHDLASVRLRAPDPVPAGVAPRIQADLVLAGPLPRGRREGLAVRFDWIYASTRSAGAGLGPGRFEKAGVTVVPLGTELAKGATTRHDRPLRFTLEVILPPRPAGLADLSMAATLVDGRSPLARAAAGTVQLPRDAFPENDGAAVRWRIGDPARIAVCAPGETALAEAMAVLGRAGFGRAFPAGDPAAEVGRGLDFFPVSLTELGPLLGGRQGPALDALLTLDLPLSALPAEDLVEFVEQRGGGWIHGAGWPRLRGDGGELEGLLALEPDRPPRDPLRVHFLADGSGSMAGERWRRTQAALGRLIPSVSPGDAFNVRFFTQVLGDVRVRIDGRPGEDVERTRADREAALVSLRRTSIPGGSTDITGSVKMLADEIDSRRQGDDPRRDLIVLLTDGLSNASGTPAKLVGDQLRASGIDAVAIHVGTDGSDQPVWDGGPSRGEVRAARRLLERICGSPGRVYPAGELGEVFSLLQQAIEGANLVENAQVRWLTPPVGAELDGPLAEALARAGDLFTQGGLFAADAVLPVRAVEGAIPLAEAVESSPGVGAEPGDDGEPAARRTLLAAVAPRGQGLVLGMAVAMGTGRELGEEAWAPAVLHRLDWWTPILQEMAARRRGVGRGAAPPARVALEPHPRSGEPWLVLRAAPGQGAAGVPAVVRGEVLVPGPVDAFGSRIPGRTLGTVNLGVAPAAFGDPGLTRAAPRPKGLDGVRRGASLELRMDAALGAARGLRFSADGPLESQALILPRPVPRALDGARPDGQPGLASPGSGSRPDPLPGPGLASILLTLIAGAGGTLVAFGAVRRAGSVHTEAAQ